MKLAIAIKRKTLTSILNVVETRVETGADRLPFLSSEFDSNLLLILSEKLCKIPTEPLIIKIIGIPGLNVQSCK
jgi:hypothetical protein